MTPTGSSTPVSQVSPAVVSPTSEVSALPSVGDGLPGGESPWSLWLLAGLLMAGAGAALSLGLQLFAFPRSTDEPPQPPAPGGGLRKLVGRSSGSGAVAMAEPPIVEAPRESDAEAQAGVRTVALTVAGVDGFDSYLDLLRALSRMPGVATVRATGLALGEGGFEVELVPSLAAEDVARELSEHLSRLVTVMGSSDAALRLWLEGRPG
jgi:hypothetical protein